MDHYEDTANQLHEYFKSKGIVCELIFIPKGFIFRFEKEEY
jgi:hypothetical protein